MAQPLAGKIALVTGSSRGIGKGVALELGAAGATVYVTGRTVDPDANVLGGTIGQTAAEIEELGGVGVPVRCDHGNDDDVRTLFDQIGREQGRLDILVNNACSAQDMGRHMGRNCWEQGLDAWDEVHRVGLRSAYVATVLAIPLMLEQRSGLIANISSLGAKIYLHSVAYGTAKAGLDKLASDVAHELRAHGIAAVSLWPGLVKTELILSSCREKPGGGLELVIFEGEGDAEPQTVDLATAETPRFSGRAVLALFEDKEVLQRSGGSFTTAELGLDYGFTDLDGSQPPVIRGTADLDEVPSSLFET